MQKRRFRWVARLVPGTAALALGLLAPAPAGAQALFPAGAEFQVNTYTTNSQDVPSVATDGDGDFVVVWESTGSSGGDTSSDSVQGQRYASDGSAQGAQFQVNTYTTGGQVRPSVAAEADGDFVVVWYSLSFGDLSENIQGQRYASNGSTQGAQFQVNTYTTDTQNIPSVAADADGDFVVVWSSRGSFGTDTSFTSIQGQRYASNGSTQGAQFQVNTYTTSDQTGPSVAADADGDFVVVWYSTGSFGTDRSLTSIQGQRYASSGSTQGAHFQVNTYTTESQALPSVSAASDGDFVVVWRSYGSSGNDTSSSSIQGQRYASNGSAQGAQFQVNTYTTQNQNFAEVSPAGDGGFVVVWHSLGSFGTDTSSASIQGQRYASNGSAQGAQFQVNTYTTQNQLGASVSGVGDGDFVVAWTSLGSSGTDASGISIQAQRYSNTRTALPAMSPATRFALAAGLLLLGAAYAPRRRR